MEYIGLFFAGAFLCNGIPHLVAGLQGMPFQSPFAKPPGVGLSSPTVNVLWGALNLLLGLGLLSRHPVAFGLNVDFIVTIAGGLVIGLHLASHFGKVRNK